jgi:hypothetical protein
MMPAPTIDPPLYRVTEVIEEAGLGADFSRIRPAVMEAAQVRGTLVHRAVELVDHGDLDDRSVPPMLRGYVDAYRLFVADVDYRPIITEHEIHHPFGFVGHPDKIGWIRTARQLVDIKTPIALAKGPLLLQLAAYDGGWNAEYPTEPLTGAGALQLGKDGRYRWREHDLHRAWRVFVYALRLLQGVATRAELHELDRWRADYRL